MTGALRSRILARRERIRCSKSIRSTGRGIRTSEAATYASACLIMTDLPGSDPSIMRHTKFAFPPLSCSKEPKRICSFLRYAASWSVLVISMTQCCLQSGSQCNSTSRCSKKQEIQTLGSLNFKRYRRCSVFLLRLPTVLNLLKEQAPILRCRLCANPFPLVLSFLF